MLPMTFPANRLQQLSGNKINMTIFIALILFSACSVINPPHKTPIPPTEPKTETTATTEKLEKIDEPLAIKSRKY